MTSQNGNMYKKMFDEIRVLLDVDNIADDIKVMIINSIINPSNITDDDIEWAKDVLWNNEAGALRKKHNDIYRE